VRKWRRLSLRAQLRTIHRLAPQVPPDSDEHLDTAVKDRFRRALRP